MNNLVIIHKLYLPYPYAPCKQEELALYREHSVCRASLVSLNVFNYGLPVFGVNEIGNVAAPLLDELAPLNEDESEGMTMGGM